jgi:hypothetical protein
MTKNDAEGAVKEEARICTCQKSKCGKSWPTRLPAPKVPKQCPYCKRTDWQVPDSILPKLQCDCTHCDWHWESELLEGPKHCPGCGTVKWREERTRVDNVCLICSFWIEGKCLRRFHRPIANRCKGWAPKVNALPVIGENICLSCYANPDRQLGVVGTCGRGSAPLNNKCRNYIGSLPEAEVQPANLEV